MLRYMTSGESHGKGLMAILDGVPAGLIIEEDFINNELARRMMGYGRGERMNIEKDKVEIISGFRKSSSIASPIGILIRNKDYKIDELPDMKCPRPGHADLAGLEKYGFTDARNVLERASARESAARVAVGAIAKLMLREFAVRIFSHVTMIGGISADTANFSSDQILKLSTSEDSKLRCADKRAEELMCREIDKAKESGDTLGGSFEVIAENMIPGLGSYVQWDKRLDGILARAVMTIPGVKAVSIGAGIEGAARKGSEVHDVITYDNAKKDFSRLSNNAGGLEGGVTNGQNIVIKAFMKPIATLGKPLRSVNIDTKEEIEASRERADICAVPACGVIAEAAAAFEIAAAFLEKFGGDSMKELRRNYEGYLKQLKEM